MVALDPSIIVSFIALLGTLFVALLGREKYGKSDAVALEGRLTSIETKLDPIWDCIMKELPKLLISPHTPEVDKLITKALDIGFDNLPREEARELYNRLGERYAIEEHPMRRLAFSLVQIALSVENGGLANR